MVDIKRNKSQEKCPVRLTDAQIRDHLEATSFHGLREWSAWRSSGRRAYAKTTPHAREMAAIGHLIAGAVSEAALVCATSDHRVRAARDFTSALLKMLAPFFQ